PTRLLHASDVEDRVRRRGERLRRRYPAAQRAVRRRWSRAARRSRRQERRRMLRRKERAPKRESSAPTYDELTYVLLYLPKVPIFSGCSQEPRARAAGL